MDAASNETVSNDTGRLGGASRLALLGWCTLSWGGDAQAQADAGGDADAREMLAATAWEALQPYLSAHQAGHEALAAGRLQEAERCFEAALLQAGEDTGAALYGLACAASLQGRQELALARFDLALEAGYWEPELFAWDPDLAALRELEGFDLRMQALALELEDGAARTASIGHAEALHFTESFWLGGETLIAGDENGMLWAFAGRDGSILQRTNALGAAVWDLVAMPAPEGQVPDEVLALLYDGTLVRWSPESPEVIARVDAFPEPNAPMTWHVRFGGRMG